MHPPFRELAQLCRWFPLWLVLVVLPLAVHAAQPDATAAGVRLIRSTTTGAVLDVHTPRPVFVPLPDGTQQLTVPGAASSNEAGKPDLPVWNAVLGVPAGATLDVQIVNDDPTHLSLAARLTPAAQPAPRTGDDGRGSLVRIADPTAYARTEPYPSEVARVAEDAMLRDQRLARIEIRPLQYIAAHQELVWHQHLRVAVRWTLPTATAWQSEPLNLNNALDVPVLNADIAAQWRVQPRSVAQPQARIAPTPRYKIEVDHDGMYRLGYADLAAAGMDLSRVDPRTLAMTSQGQPVAIEVLGEADGRFDSGDEVRFWGEQFRAQAVSDTIVMDGQLVVTDTRLSALYSNATTYTDRNVYWLAAGSTPGLRMKSVDGTPSDTTPPASLFRSVVHAEQSNRWWTWHFTNRDTWFWDRIQSSTPTTRTYAATLPTPAATDAMASVTGEIVARSDNPGINPDQHVRVLLNGTLVTDAQWDGRGRYRFAGEVPQTALVDGANMLALEVLPPAGTSADLWLDWFEVAYDRRLEAQNDQIVIERDAGTARYTVDNFTTPNVRVYNISDPSTPSMLDGATMTADATGYHAAFDAQARGRARYVALAQGALQQPAAITRYVAPDLSNGGADYIVIAPRELVAASQRLAQYRAAQGMRTVVVNLDDLYNVFNDGIVHPVAIKRFLAYAYVYWQAPTPRYVVLVGDGHWNMKGYAPERYGTAPSLMPPNLVWVDPWQGEVDSTNLLAAIVGDDFLPDVAIGRLPANTVAELDTMIDKIVAYEAAPSLQPWQRRLVFVADNGPDPAGDFAALSNIFINEEVTAPMIADRLYLDDVCGPAANPPAPCPAATAQLINTLNSGGALLVNYAGHGSVNRWAHEQVLTTSDIAALHNSDRLPVVLSMTCLDGYWFDPLQASLAEALVRAPNAGAVATFSPTGLGVANGHDVLQRGFYRALFRDGIRTLGPATIAAKQALFATGQHDDLINTFVIIGDPALRLPIPSTTYAPFIVGAQR